jgi:hypothetical protein
MDDWFLGKVIVYTTLLGVYFIILGIAVGGLVETLRKRGQ